MKPPIPPLTIFNFFSYKGPNIYDVQTEMGWRGLEICRVFTDSIVFKQQIYCSFLQMRVVWSLILKLTLIKK